MGAPGATGAGSSPDKPPHVTREIAAEAAVWVSRLHGPARTRQMEREYQDWQSRSPAHRHAFERCTEVWMEIPNAARAAGYSPTLSTRPVPDPRRIPPAWAIAAVITFVGVGALVGWQFWPSGADYRTAVGEAQTVVLSDGTRMSLNTDTRVHVELDSTQRTVSIAGGEASFEVAKDAKRPFVVRAAGSEVVALGTIFSVRHTHRASAAESVSVTLVEGRVAVRAAADAEAGDVAPAEQLLMQPGDRMLLVKDSKVQPQARQLVDRPNLERVLAWKRNEALFDKTPLLEAVAEMNRYSRTPVVLVGDLARADWLVSGQFRTGDNAGFAHAMATLHGLEVRERPDRLELVRKP